MRLNQEKKLRSRQGIKLFISILVVTNLATGGFLIYETKFRSAANNPYPLIDISRNFIPQEYFFSTIEHIRKEIKQIVANYEKEGNHIGVYFEFLNTGANVSVNQDMRFWKHSHQYLKIQNKRQYDFPLF